ncbi:hypothetical protein LCGC14_1436430 [marine sediment metagenome]|uniref:HNH nuclease domain-containing protein n=1 Tax=marine sediment metagenome TaxID=412755 RepID=A0A0F9MNX3_9ZZZZ
MEFPEKVKKKAKKASSYKCCFCHDEPVMEVHHINPNLKLEGGLQDFDNAAPLCANCHNKFGNDSKKRKMIREIRDYWYETVEKKYGPQLEELQKLSTKVEEIKDGQLQLHTLIFPFVVSLKDAEQKQDVEGTKSALNTLSAAVSTIASSTIVKSSVSESRCTNCGQPNDDMFSTYCKGCRDKLVGDENWDVTI